VTRPRQKDRHLPPCVYFKHGAYWYVKGGKWTWLGVTLAEALEAYAAIVETPEGTMPKVIDDALAWMRARKPPLAKSTLSQYAGAAKILKRKLAQFRPEQVQPKHVAAIKVSMAGKPNMGNRCLSFLRQVFDYLLEQQVIPANPAVGVKRHKEAERDRLLTPEEQAQIYEQAGPRLQVILDLMFATGQRVNAVLTIQLQDLVEKGIRFPQFKTPTKRIVKWTPEIRAATERAKALRGNVRSLTWLLPGRPGKPPNYRSVKLQFDKACLAAGVENAQMRDYRAVSATEAEKQGKNPTKLLGHTSPQRTRRYLRSKEEPVVEGPSFRQSNRHGKKSS
jgi:integrase